MNTFIDHVIFPSTLHGSVPLSLPPPLLTHSLSPLPLIPPLSSSFISSPSSSPSSSSSSSYFSLFLLPLLSLLSLLLLLRPPQCQQDFVVLIFVSDAYPHLLSLRPSPLPLNQSILRYYYWGSAALLTNSPPLDAVCSN